MSQISARRPGRLRAAWGWVRQHARLRIVAPVLVGAGLAAYVVSVAIAPKSGGEFWAALRGAWWVALLLTFPYLAIRAFVWWRLLRELGIKIRWRPLAVAFAAGEATKTLPAGIYVENYLLARLAHYRAHGAIRSSMATTAMLGLESLVAVPALLIIGLPGQTWLFWTVLGVVIAWIVILAVVWLAVRFGERHLGPNTPGWLTSATKGAKDFLAAGGDLLTPRTAEAIVPTMAYMFVYVVDLYAIVRALGIHNISIKDATAIYAFVVLTVVLIPIPTEIGLTEFSGLSALLAYGVPRPLAAIVMLSLRSLVTGATIVVAGLVLLVLRHELTKQDEASQDEPGGQGKEDQGAGERQDRQSGAERRQPAGG